MSALIDSPAARVVGGRLGGGCSGAEALAKAGDFEEFFAGDLRPGGGNVEAAKGHGEDGRPGRFGFRQLLGCGGIIPLIWLLAHDVGMAVNSRALRKDRIAKSNPSPWVMTPRLPLPQGSSVWFLVSWWLFFCYRGHYSSAFAAGCGEFSDAAPERWTECLRCARGFSPRAGFLAIIRKVQVFSAKFLKGGGL